MKRLTWILFFIALVIVGIETFRPQPPFPGATSNVSRAQAPAVTGGNL